MTARATSSPLPWTDAPSTQADATAPSAAPDDSRRAAQPAPVGDGRRKTEGPKWTWRLLRLPPPAFRLWLVLALAVALDLGLCGAGAAVGGYELLAVQHQVRGAGPSRLAVEGPALRTRLGVAAPAFGLARFCSWPR